jgi:hypothetical protein
VNEVHITKQVVGSGYCSCCFVVVICVVVVAREVRITKNHNVVGSGYRSCFFRVVVVVNVVIHVGGGMVSVVVSLFVVIIICV